MSHSLCRANENAIGGSVKIRAQQWISVTPAVLLVRASLRSTASASLLGENVARVCLMCQERRQPTCFRDKDVE